jgi:hypothetical protein
VPRQSVTVDHEGMSINLKDPLTAAFLAWLLPGLGHLYQGRRAKAVLFFVCIMGTFVYGCYLGSSNELGYARVVYASVRRGDWRLPYFCQIGVGLPALPALVQAMRVRGGREPFGWFMAPPRLDTDDRDPPTIDRLNKQMNRYFELGTAYTMIAGLLNVLAIYDAWGGPVAPHKKEDEEEEADQDEGPGADDSAGGTS